MRRSFDDLLEQTGWRLARLHEVRAQKQYLRLLGSLPGYLDRLEGLLASSDDQEGSEQVSRCRTVSGDVVDGRVSSVV